MKGTIGISFKNKNKKEKLYKRARKTAFAVFLLDISRFYGALYAEKALYLRTQLNSLTIRLENGTIKLFIKKQRGMIEKLCIIDTI